MDSKICARANFRISMNSILVRIRRIRVRSSKSWRILEIDHIRNSKGERVYGDFATGLIFSLNIHEEGTGDIASPGSSPMLIFETSSRLFGACNERKVFFKFHKGFAG